MRGSFRGAVVAGGSVKVAAVSSTRFSHPAAVVGASDQSENGMPFRFFGQGPSDVTVAI